MSEKVSHRGPDDSGIYISANHKVGLGHRRLSIIDLSSNGHQPMIYKNRFVIVFNGEIYNYQKLRSDLIKKGTRFKSKTDTEVLLTLYAKHGTKCLEFLRGFFAFAIYDQVKETLFLARDRMGKKPLKYYFDGNIFCFASELKALLTQKEIHAKPDFIAINNYLTFGYIPAPFTGFEDIYKLEPGHYLFVDLKKESLLKRRYWKPDFSEKLQMTEGEWIRKFQETFEESVKLRMIADVPIGAFLSGGVDSSAVVAMMARNSVKPIKTFTIGSRVKKYDESKYADIIAKKYKTEHTVLIAEPESVESLPELVETYEEPFADASNVITCMVSKLARKHVKVILNGDGGDENFAGYDRYWRLRRDALLNNQRHWISPLGLSLTERLKNFSNSPRIKRAENFLHKLDTDFAYKLMSYNFYFLPSDKEKLLSYNFSSLTKYEDSLEVIRKSFTESGAKDLCDQALYFDLTTYLPDDLLVKVDMASMSVGLEVRSPFLDREVVDLASKIPFNLKLSPGGESKYILKKALRGLVPDENLYRKKMGFSIPLDKWFTGDLGKYAKHILLSKNALRRELFDTKYVKNMLMTHSVKNDYGPKLWTLLNLELWFERYFEKN